MDTYGYFMNLHKLCEDNPRNVTMNGVNPAQNDIANNGADLYDPAAEQDPQMQEDAPNEGMTDDAAYMDQGMQSFNPVDSKSNDVVSDVSDNTKLLKLYGLFKDLKNYGKEFIETLEIVDTSLIEKDDLVEFKKYKNYVKEQIQKISDYIILRLATDKYEKALYVYILLRTEFLTTVKKLRELLNLNEKI